MIYVAVFKFILVAIAIDACLRNANEDDKPIVPHLVHHL